MEYSQTENISGEPINLLDDEAILLNQFVYASTGQRFLNWLIDNLVMRYGLSYLSGYSIGLIIGLLKPDLLVGLTRNSITFWLLAYLIAFMNYLFYYVICEKLFNGYTIGKLITGTKAIRDDGQALTIKSVLLRTLCRLVPFEVFSGFKTRPWHDEWSNTMVVRAR